MRGTKPIACPSCGVEQQSADAKDCYACGVNFEKWSARQARKEMEQLDPALKPPPPITVSRQAFPWVPLVAILGSPFLLWFLVKAPAGNPVVKGSYQDPIYGFAIPIPEGWTAQRVNDQKDDHINVVRIDGPATGGSTPVIEVAVSDRKLPRSTKSYRIINDIVASVYKGQFGNGYNLEDPRAVEIDKLPAFRMTGDGTHQGAVAVLSKGVPLHEVTFKQRLGFTLALVKGADCTYFVRGTADFGDFPSRADAFDQAIRGFRVLERPFSVDHVWRLLTGKLREEAVAVLFGMIFALYKFVFTGLISLRD